MTLQAANSPTMNGGWFGPANHKLFGQLHAPRESADPTIGAVLCPPLQADYDASHLAYRALADRLADRGVAALRFDYYGTGDSGGDPATVASVDVWLEDVATAVGFLRDGGWPRVGLIGMRAGALLAAEAAGRGAADFLVLWDPVTSGRAFLRESTLLGRQAIAAQWEEGRLVSSAGPPPEVEAEGGSRRAAPLTLLGFDFPDSFGETFGRLQVPTRPPAVARI